jgi:alpha-aminoadipic semialdehyde synthase
VFIPCCSRTDDFVTRYPGFFHLMHAFKAIGLLDTEHKIRLDSWPSLLRQTLEKRLGIPIRDSTSLISALKDLLPSSSDVDPVLRALNFLRLTRGSSKTLVNSITLPSVFAAPIDHLATLLAQALRYEPHERDLVILSHEIIAQDSVCHKREVYSSSLITYGTSEASAMSRCVGLPVAFAALQILDGKIAARGVWGPGVEKGLWAGVLNGLNEVGLGMTENMTVCGSETITVENTLARDFLC